MGARKGKSSTSSKNRRVSNIRANKKIHTNGFLLLSTKISAASITVGLALMSIGAYLLIDNINLYSSFNMRLTISLFLIGIVAFTIGIVSLLQRPNIDISYTDYNILKIRNSLENKL
jgi:NADH:ubiquinone oxidoreductase subunit K